MKKGGVYMAGDAMHNLTYGLYVLTARDGDRHNGCIIDTAVQVASAPAKLSICVSDKRKSNP